MWIGDYNISLFGTSGLYNSRVDGYVGFEGGLRSQSGRRACGVVRIGGRLCIPRLTRNLRRCRFDGAGDGCVAFVGRFGVSLRNYFSTVTVRSVSHKFDGF